MNQQAVFTTEIKTIVTEFFVRTALNEARVEFFTKLIREGHDLPPIELAERDGRKLLTDGRHRMEAQLRLGKTQIEYTKAPAGLSIVELIARAYRANSGGPLPPTEADSEHTVRILLQNKTSLRRIAELLGLPAGLTRRYVCDIQSKDQKKKLQLARDAIACDGLTVAQAAAKYEVEQGTLKRFIGGKKEGKKDSVEIKQGILTAQRAMTIKVSNLLKKAKALFEDGTVTAKDIHELEEVMEDGLRKQRRLISNWKRRVMGVADADSVEDS